MALPLAHCGEISPGIAGSDVRMQEPQRDVEAANAGYTKTKQLQVQFETRIETLSLLEDLLQMTPHGTRAHPDRLDNIAQLLHQPLTVDVNVKLYTLKS